MLLLTLFRSFLLIHCINIKEQSEVAIRRAIVRLSDRLLMNLWHGFCFLNEESSSHRFGGY